MNIFYLDHNPQLAAQYHADKHVVKMVLETAQILSTNMRYFGMEYGYRSTHLNHPCTKWARESRLNWIWTWQLGIHLLEEYTYRFGKTHASYYIINDALPEFDWIFEKNERTHAAQCMPDAYAIRSYTGIPYQIDYTVDAYRQYYRGAKQNMLTYTRRPIPSWIKDVGLGIQK